MNLLSRLTLSSRQHLACVIGLASLSVGYGQESQLQQWAKMMPEGVTVLTAVRDSGELLKDYEQSGVGGFFKDPLVKEWLSPKAGKNGEKSLEERTKEMLGMSWEDWMRMYSGTVAVGICYQDKKLDMITLASAPADTAAQLKVRDSDLAERKKKDPTLARSEEEIAGVKVQVEAGEKPESRRFWAVTGGLEIISSDRMLMKQMLGNVAAGGGKNLSLQKQLNKALEKAGADADMVVVLDLASMTSVLQSQLAEMKPDNAMAMFASPEILRAIGVTEMESLSLAATLKDGLGYLDVVVKHSAEPTGLITSLFRTTAAEASPLPLVPADADSFSVASYSIPQVYENLLQCVLKLGPLGGMAMMQVSALEQQLKVKFKEDVVDALDDSLFQVQFIGEGEDLVGTSVTGVKLKDKAKLEKSLPKLMASSVQQGSVEAATVEGNTVWTMKPALKGKEASSLRFSLMLTDGYLLLCQGQPAQVQKVVARLKDASGPSGWDSAEVKSALALLPPHSSSLSITKPTAVVRQLAKVTSLTGGAKDAATQAVAPTAELVQKYFGTLAGGYYVSPDGTHARMILTPGK